MAVSISPSSESVARRTPVSGEPKDLTAAYLDTPTESLPQLQGLVDDTATAEDLRRSSLLASSTILRVLAGVFHNLAVDPVNDIPELRDGGLETARQFFEKLAPHMDAPVLVGNPWMETGVFPEEGGWHRGRARRSCRASRTL